MKKLLSLVLALVMVLGCMTVPAFAEEDPYTGNTTITANVAKPDVEYEIVIPQAVTMNEAGVVPIGEAKIDITGDKLKYATEKTVISYTASGTNFKLSTDESKTMTATYYSAYTDKDTNTVLDSTKAIDVYKNSALVDPLTKLYVGVSQTDWDTAATTNPGTYTATVTYNFSAEEAVTIADILPNDFPTTKGLWASEPTVRYTVYKNSENLTFVDQGDSSTNFFNVPLTTPVAAVAGGYECSVGDASFTFNMTGNALTSIVAADTGKDDLNGTYTEGISAQTLKDTYAAGVSSWKSETDKCIVWDYNSFWIDSSTYAQYLLYKSGENQYKKTRNGTTFTFNITDDALASIEVTGYWDTDYNGTYTASTVD